MAREDEVVHCVQLILSCEVGSLVDQSAFGITDPTFSVTPNLLLLEHEITGWEPRAMLEHANTLDPEDFSIRGVQISVRDQTGERACRIRSRRSRRGYGRDHSLNHWCRE